MQFEVTDTDGSAHNYNIGSSFSLDEWVYWGVSIYRQIRAKDNYGIHLITKTKAGVVNQNTFNNQNFTINWEAYGSSELDNKYIVVLGSGLSNTTVSFTGYLNMILAYTIPQMPIEMLANAYRSPVEVSRIYEPFLVSAIIVKDYNTSEFMSGFYDFSYLSNYKSYGGTTTSLSAKDLISDKISVCQFHVVNVSNWE